MIKGFYSSNESSAYNGLIPNLNASDINKCRCLATVLLVEKETFNLLALRTLLEEDYEIFCHAVNSGD